MACHCRNTANAEPFEHTIHTTQTDLIYDPAHYGRWGFRDEVIEWLASDEARGYFTAEEGWIDYDDGSEEFVLKMSFSDADTAFAFKMRWC